MKKQFFAALGAFIVLAFSVIAFSCSPEEPNNLEPPANGSENLSLELSQDIDLTQYPLVSSEEFAKILANQSSNERFSYICRGEFASWRITLWYDEQARIDGLVENLNTGMGRYIHDVPQRLADRLCALVETPPRSITTYLCYIDSLNYITIENNGTYCLTFAGAPGTVYTDVERAENMCFYLENQKGSGPTHNNTFSSVNTQMRDGCNSSHTDPCTPHTYPNIQTGALGCFSLPMPVFHLCCPAADLECVNT